MDGEEAALCAFELLDRPLHVNMSSWKSELKKKEVKRIQQV